MGVYENAIHHSVSERRLTELCTSPASAPAPSSAPISSPTHEHSPTSSPPLKRPLPHKAQDVLFGGGKSDSNKAYDKLGVSKAMVDKFIDNPKAFQQLGLYEERSVIDGQRHNSEGTHQP